MADQDPDYATGPSSEEEASGDTSSSSGSELSVADEGPDRRRLGNVSRRNSQGNHEIRSLDALPAPKRKREHSPAPHSLKRRRGIFYPDYLQILNQEIEDATGRSAASLRAKGRLRDAQLGVSQWTGDEKQLCLEGVARLGRDDVEGIAARVGTKGALEVAQYLTFLNDASNKAIRAKPGFEPQTVDFPAAVELSEDCCRALEVAADAVSVRVEADEDEAEQAQWGKVWNVTAEVADEIEQSQDSISSTADRDPPPFANLFILPNWIELSTRIFMNSANPDYSWQFAGNHLPQLGRLYQKRSWKALLQAEGEQPPSVRATALEDFSSLAVSITRKLVMATMFVAESRYKAQGVIRRGNRVRRKDVFGAAASIGLKANSREFWRRAPRRLGLHVYRRAVDCPVVVNYERRAPLPPMSYDDVEKELADDHEGVPSEHGARQDVSESSQNEEIGDASGEDSDDAISSQGTSDRGRLDGDFQTQESEEEEAIDDELRELLVHVGHVGVSKGMRSALERRIREERELEAYANARDAGDAYREEAGLWAVLEKERPAAPAQPDDPGKRPRRRCGPVGELYPTRVDWRNRLRYYSEWETGLGKEGTSKTFRLGKWSRSQLLGYDEEGDTRIHNAGDGANELDSSEVETDSVENN